MNYDWMRKRRKSILCLLVGVMILLLLQGILGFRQNEMYYREDGQVKGVQRNQKDGTESIPLIVEYSEKGVKKTYQVSLTFVSENDADGRKGAVYETEGNQIESLIDEIVRNMEREEGNFIRLPARLEQGTILTWKSPSAADDGLTLLLFPLGIWYLYRSDMEKEKRRKQRKCDEIKRALPAFNDQLLLLMNSGLIFHDAFQRISANYKRRESDNAFFSLVSSIGSISETTGQSLVSVMKISAKDVSVREYSRLVNILVDNQLKGVDLREKLDGESHLLWEMRKALSLQKGKEMETKLSFPLAVLLIVLMIIAGAPAMLTM